MPFYTIYAPSFGSRPSGLLYVCNPAFYSVNASTVQKVLRTDGSPLDYGHDEKTFAGPFEKLIVLGSAAYDYNPLDSIEAVFTQMNQQDLTQSEQKTVAQSWHFAFVDQLPPETARMDSIDDIVACVETEAQRFLGDFSAPWERSRKSGSVQRTLSEPRDWRMGRIFNDVVQNIARANPESNRDFCIEEQKDPKTGRTTQKTFKRRAPRRRKAKPA